MQIGFHTLTCNCWIQVNRITGYQVSREVPSLNLNTLVNLPVRSWIYKKNIKMSWFLCHILSFFCVFKNLTDLSLNIKHQHMHLHVYRWLSIMIGYMLHIPLIFFEGTVYLHFFNTTLSVFVAFAGLTHNWWYISDRECFMFGGIQKYHTEKDITS